MVSSGAGRQCRLPDIRTQKVAVTVSALHLSTSDARLQAFCSSAWFAGVASDLQAWLAEHARPLVLAAGQRLFSRGEPCEAMYFVVDGAIRITSFSADGREALLTFAENPQWFSDSGLFDGAPHSHDAWAESDALLLRIGQQALIAFLELHPAHWRALGMLLAQKLKLAFIGLESVALLPLPTRLAQRLVAIATGYGDWNGRNRQVIAVQQDQLGGMLGLSRQTVNQILREFEAQGMLRRTRGSIEIVDFERLRQLARL
jgi:CRP/FNR family transcriptional regulator, cyclic AMP receptor protein